MTAIIRRELNAYFSSPLGYVFIAVYLIFSGAFFYLFTLSSGSADLSYVFLGMFIVLMVFVPVLTMRLMSEDIKQKTDQLTLTAPLGLFSLVFGKFLAAYAIFALSSLVLLIYAVVLSLFATVAWTIVIGNMIAILLIGAIYVAAGLFISTLTENQMIAAIGAIALNIAFFLMDTLASVIPVEFISNIISGLSVYSKYTRFTMGLFSIGDALYMVSVAAVFIFLTIRILERRRWA